MKMYFVRTGEHGPCCHGPFDNEVERSQALLECLRDTSWDYHFDVVLYLDPIGDSDNLFPYTPEIEDIFEDGEPTSTVYDEEGESWADTLEEKRGER